MEIAIRSTDQLIEVDGVRVRVWEGVTRSGVECVVMVHRLAVHKDEDAEQFAAELAEQHQPASLSTVREYVDAARR